MRNQKVYVSIIGGMVAVATERNIAVTQITEMISSEAHLLVTKAEDNGETRRSVRARIAHVTLDLTTAGI